ncbi:MAG TPA: YqiA/YcfP family alpha/beta fold hydrolase [Bryobacteraceae bacterium]|nr:YqiA/YcfP family alpha/beta fold hydrolase [Bryobacteraceae bacterium]
MTRVVYLHGFASSPGSGKAQFFARRFAEHGVAVDIPQLDEGNFRELTITGQLSVIGRAVGERPAVLMGSSLGGYLAALYASTHASIERLVLMAPAFRFPARWRERYAGDLERWEREGSLPFFHYAFQDERLLGYRFVEDAAQYPDEPNFPQPALILHGTRDTVVPAAMSQEYAESHPNVQLRLYDSAHELTDVLEPMWNEVARFVGISGVPKPIAK